MCEFEDVEVISSYSRKQAVQDGVIVEISRWNGKPVMATSHIADEIALHDLIKIWHEFRHWREFDKPALPEEDHLFHTGMNDKAVWVVEDDVAFTLMYPEDY